MQISPSTTIAICLCCLLVGCSDPGASPPPPNVLLICVDDLRPELGVYGKEYIHSPNIDALAAEGALFRRHYVNAPSCGPSRFTLLTGRYGPPHNDALFRRADWLASDTAAVPPSMPEWFRARGYTTVSVGKVSHHPGGRGGPDWNDSAQIEMPGAWDRHLMPVGPWRHPRGAMHGLANGEIRVVPKEMDVVQSAPGNDTIYPDGGIANAALRELNTLTTADKPFFLAVGFIRPHLPFGAPERYLQYYTNTDLPPIPHPEKPSGRTTWHGSGEFNQYNLWDKDPGTDAAFADTLRRHYAACVSYADAQVGKVLDALTDSGATENTIVVLWGDHGWHLGEHAIWGKHSLFEESLHAPLIIRFPGVIPAGSEVDEVVETRSLFPTLTALAGLPEPPSATGLPLPMGADAGAGSGGTAVAYTGQVATIRTPRHRLILHADGHAELYDHHSRAGETVNVAATHPGVVAELSAILENQLSDRLGAPLLFRKE